MHTTNVPIPDDTLLETVNKVSSFPRDPSQAGLVLVKLKRKIQYTNHHIQAYVNPAKLRAALQKLKDMGHPSYQEITITASNRFSPLAAEDDSDIGPVPKEAYVKLPSGVVYADLKPGTGEKIQGGSRVNMQWVLRKSNGYFVDSSDVSGGVPFIFNVGDGNAIAGVDEGVRGMRGGGIRRLLIPPRLAYVDGLEDGKPGPLPVGYGPRQQMRRVQTVRADVPGEYVFLEVKVTRVR